MSEEMPDVIGCFPDKPDRLSRGTYFAGDPVVDGLTGKATPYLRIPDGIDPADAMVVSHAHFEEVKSDNARLGLQDAIKKERIAAVEADRRWFLGVIVQLQNQSGLADWLCQHNEELQDALFQASREADLAAQQRKEQDDE